MQTSVPSLSRVLTMAVFALSCFGLLLFLWLSFGGPVPLKPQGYRVQVAFPEATTLATEADVRIAGVSVGKVRKLAPDEGRNRTLATIELEREFAPLQQGTRAMLRQKTLLGETYVELAPGGGARSLPEGGRLAGGRVADTVQLDEIFDSLDPATRQAFRTWQQDLAKGIGGPPARGRDFNDALGTLPGFAADGNDVLSVLASQSGALQRLVKNTGVTFDALTENEQQLRTLITSSKRVFDATASRNDALAESIRIFPTFLDESKATFARLQRFSSDTRPLVQDLRPVARDLKPTLADVRALAPDLERFFRDLDPLITASKTGLPAAREVLEGAGPLLARMHPFLGQLNPMLQYMEFSQLQVSDFISYGAAALADTTASPGGGVGHYLRQFGPTGAESAAIYHKRLKTNRGSTYVGPGQLVGPELETYLMTASSDCANAGGRGEAGDERSEGVRPSEGTPGCWTAPHQRFGGRLQGDFPHVEATGYAGGD
jgi:phospholipid/cholesterol/gamma-HCH transport system substrate-binding protein